MNEDEIRKAVRERYAQVAVQEKLSGQSCCGSQESSGEFSCCAPQESAGELNCRAPQGNTGDAGCCNIKDVASRAIGYSDKELGAIPQGANMGLGCGNPTALASLKKSEVVLDLGSGGGIDCFLAAEKVGESGRVIGVDMTPEMIELARENIRKVGSENVEFRLGEIENLPLADHSVDVIISNCVINLSPDKSRVFKESYRVLKPGGRVMVSDIVLLKELPESIKSSMAAYAGCIAGAAMKEDYLATITGAGFKDVEILSEITMGVGETEGAIASVNVRAVK